MEREIPIFDYLDVTLIILDVFLLFTLFLICIKYTKINYFYVFSISIICIVLGGSLAIATGYIIDEYGTSIHGTTFNLEISIICLAILNPIIYIFRNIINNNN